MTSRCLLACFALAIVSGCGSSTSDAPATTGDETSIDTGTTPTPETATPDDTSTPTDLGTVDSSAPLDLGVTDTATPIDTGPEVSLPEDPLAGMGPVTKVAGSFGFTEGTLWVAKGSYLLFSDIPNTKIHKMVDDKVEAAPFRAMSGGSNGLALDTSGRLLAAEHGNRRISRTNADGTVVTVVDQFEGKNLNSPNDLIVRSDGSIYFTDPTYGLAGRPRGVTFQGVYRVDPAGTITALSKDMNQPNGIMFSPDEKTLYVSDSASGYVRKHAVNPDGSVGAPVKMFDTGGGGDGMCMDDAGNLYVTTSAGLKVYKPDGTLRGTIKIPEGPTNCSFGGADRKTVYISAQTSIYKVVLKMPGLP